MRTLLIVASVLLVTACGKKEPAPQATKAPETKAPETKAPEPKVEATTVAPAPPDAPDVIVPPSDADALETMIDNLLAPEDAVEAHEVALYLVDTKTLYYTESYSVEGTGVGVNLVARDDSGKVTTTAVEAPGGADEEHPPLGLAGAKALMLKTLAGHTVIALEPQAWPVENAETADAKPAKTMTLSEPSAILTFANNVLTITDIEGKPLATLDVSKDATKPHKAVMGQVFASPKLHVLLVDVGFDPGASYGEYNYFSKTYVVTLP